MKTLWCKNQENPSDRISHAWAPSKETEDVTFLIVRRTLEMFQRFHDYMSII